MASVSGGGGSWLVGAGLVRVVFSVCGSLLGWLGVWLGSLGVSCFRLRVLSMFVEVLYG